MTVPVIVHIATNVCLFAYVFWLIRSRLDKIEKVMLANTTRTAQNEARIEISKNQVESIIAQRHEEQLDRHNRSENRIVAIETHYTHMTMQLSNIEKMVEEINKKLP